MSDVIRKFKPCSTIKSRWVEDKSLPDPASPCKNKNSIKINNIQFRDYYVSLKKAEFEKRKGPSSIHSKTMLQEDLEYLAVKPYFSGKLGFPTYEYLRAAIRDLRVDYSDITCAILNGNLCFTGNIDFRTWGDLKGIRLSQSVAFLPYYGDNNMPTPCEALISIIGEQKFVMGYANQNSAMRIMRPMEWRKKAMKEYILENL